MLSHKEKCKKWYEENKEKRKISKKAWYEKNRESSIQKVKDWKKENIQHQKEYRQNYYLQNKEKLIKQALIYTNRRRLQHKQELVNYLGGKCAKCGYNKYLGALEFHHKDPKAKEFNMRMSLKMETLKKEADKCILLCSNCHKETHGGV